MNTFATIRLQLQHYEHRVQNTTQTNTEGIYLSIYILKPSQTTSSTTNLNQKDAESNQEKGKTKPVKSLKKTFMVTLCCMNCHILIWKICLTRARGGGCREREGGEGESERKRIINYFCELLHGRDNKPAWSPWI